MNLVIVESPTKSKTISHFLGSDFIVRSSFGHIRDLPKGELGVNLDNDFTPKYVIPTKARKNVSQLKKEVAKSDTIILATDEDREGEAIAWHLTQALGLESSKQVRDSKSKIKKVERIVFHEITKIAIDEALKRPRNIDQNLVDAQQARRILDRIVGYKLSPFLWKKVARGLSAGRVQSVAVRLVVEREREIEKFNPEEYWTITASLQSQVNSKNNTNQDKRSFDAFLIKIGDKVLDKLDIKNKNQTDQLLKNLAGAKYTISNLEKKESTRSPFGPFTTSTLQQDGAKKLGFSSKQTMVIAQQLYEGVELGPEGSVGLITYMRTDSMNLSQESLSKASQYILREFGEKYLEQRNYKTKSRGAQEAHEAVRPTEPSRHPDSIKQFLTPQQFKLYNLIWRRFMASQMPKAIFDATAIDVITNGQPIKQAGERSTAINYTFRANGSVLKFDGFLKVYPAKFSENELPMVNDGEELDLKELRPEQHFTKPPARYNEASLIKTLEKEGIGRPSTYAPTISTILARNYVEKDRSKYFHPTEIGKMVNDVLVAHFPKIVDIEFTSKMEEDLDKIAAGEKKWIPVMRDFYVPFEKNLEIKYKEVSKEEVTGQEKTGQVCEKCGGEMIIKMGRYGKFVACSNFPECKNILKDNKEKEEPEKTGEKCDKCEEGELVIRKGRFGDFLACNRYPKCKNTKKIKKDEPSSEASEQQMEK